VSDSLATLRQALAPKAGMRRIPFPLESYEHPSLPLSAKRLLNVMAEEAPADARTHAALVPTPGLAPHLAVGSGPIHAINTDLPGVMYFISGTRAYGYRGIHPGDPAAVLWDMGDVGSPSPGGLNPIHLMTPTIAVSTQAVVVCVPPNAFTAPTDFGASLNQIGGTFPGANSVTFIDGYFAFSSTDAAPQSFFISRLYDPLAYDALDFASLDEGSNAVLRIVTHAGELWVVGMAGFEIWYNSGDADFPFRRRLTGGVIERAIGTPRSLAQIDGSVFWLGLDGIVYRSVGYQATRISTHAVEAAIAALGAGAVADCFGNGYMDQGHAFYVLTLLNVRTLVYDCNTKVWHDRASSIDGAGAWRPHVLAPQNNGTLNTLAGDPVVGEVYILDHTISTDNGLEVARGITFPPIFAGTNRAFCHRVEVETEVGTEASHGDLTLDWSDDGGITWTGGPRTLSAGAVGETRHRAFTTRLGSFRQRVLRLGFTGRRTVYGLDADISGGTGG